MNLISLLILYTLKKKFWEEDLHDKKNRHIYHGQNDCFNELKIKIFRYCRSGRAAAAAAAARDSRISEKGFAKPAQRAALQSPIRRTELICPDTEKIIIYVDLSMHIQTHTTAQARRLVQRLCWNFCPM